MAPRRICPSDYPLISFLAEESNKLQVLNIKEISEEFCEMYSHSSKTYPLKSLNEDAELVVDHKLRIVKYIKNDGTLRLGEHFQHKTKSLPIVKHVTKVVLNKNSNEFEYDEDTFETVRASNNTEELRQITWTDGVEDDDVIKISTLLQMLSNMVDPLNTPSFNKYKREIGQCSNTDATIEVRKLVNIIEWALQYVNDNSKITTEPAVLTRDFFMSLDSALIIQHPLVDNLRSMIRTMIAEIELIEKRIKDDHVCYVFEKLLANARFETCSSQLQPAYKMHERLNFPKVELHLHLDGAARFNTLLELAQQKDISLAGAKTVEELKNVLVTHEPANLSKVLDAFEIVLPVIRGDLAAIERVSYELCEDQHNNGVVYFEGRYSPHLLLCDDYPEVTAAHVVAAVKKGFDRGEI